MPRISELDGAPPRLQPALALPPLRPLFFSPLWALAALIALLGVRAEAQVIRGSIRDEVSKQPIGRATVVLMGARDTVLSQIISTDSGRYTFTVAPGSYSLSIRRVGWSPIITNPFRIRATDTLTADFLLERAARMLDTVVSVETSGVFAMTPGKEFVRKHFLSGMGMQISGFEIEKSGLSLSEFLGRQPGVVLSSAYLPDTPVAPARDGMALTSRVANQCLYVRLDRASLLFKLVSEGAETIDEIVRVADIMAVEVYLDRAEVPKEWAQDAFVEELYTRRNAGKKYTIGNIGFPTISPDLIADEPSRFETRKVPLDRPGSPKQPGDPTHIPPCGFLQIWTRIAW